MVQGISSDRNEGQAWEWTMMTVRAMFLRWTLRNKDRTRHRPMPRWKECEGVARCEREVS